MVVYVCGRVTGFVMFVGRIKCGFATRVGGREGSVRQGFWVVEGGEWGEGVYVNIWQPFHLLPPTVPAQLIVAYDKCNKSAPHCPRACWR